MQIEIEIIGETKWIVVDVYIPEILERVQEILVEAELEMRQTGEDQLNCEVKYRPQMTLSLQ